MSENTVGTETKKVTSWGRNIKPRKGRLLFFIAVACVLIGGISYFMYINNTKNQKVTNQCSSIEKEPLLKDIYVVLQKENKLDLKTYVEKIQGIPGYENDPNCLYPIVVYQIYRGDSVQASNVLELLKTAYVPTKGYSPLYGTDTRTPDQLDKVVDSMVKESERASGQFDYLGKEPKQ